MVGCEAALCMDPVNEDRMCVRTVIGGPRFGGIRVSVHPCGGDWAIREDTLPSFYRDLRDPRCREQLGNLPKISRCCQWRMSHRLTCLRTHAKDPAGAGEVFSRGWRGF